MSLMRAFQRVHPFARLRRYVGATSTSIRVLHVLSSLDVGGMEQFVVRIAKHQKSRGVAAGILALRGGPLVREALDAGIEVSTLEGRALLRRVFRAVRVAARFAPDVIHVHNTTSLQYGSLCAMVLGCPYLMTFHGQGSGFRQTSSLVWNSVSAVVSVSAASSHKVAEYVEPERVSVIPNGVEMRQYLGIREEKRRELGFESQVVAIMVARMDGLKGHGDFLDALAMLRDGASGCPLTVLLVGDGAQRNELEKRANELELDETWVRFLGYRSDVADLLECADLFVLPSLTEGMPLSVLEAMAAGLPIVASDVGGLPELIENEREGLLVPARQPRELMLALCRVGGDAELRTTMGRAARARVEGEFSFERMLERYEELYDRVQQKSAH